MQPADIVNHLLEGHGIPGRDLPVIFRVRFTYGGRGYDINVEAKSTNRESKIWAANRAIASVLRSLNQSPNGLLLHSIRNSSSFSCKDVSATAEIADIGINLSKKAQKSPSTFGRRVLRV